MVERAAYDCLMVDIDDHNIDATIAGQRQVMKCHDRMALCPDMPGLTVLQDYRKPNVEVDENGRQTVGVAEGTITVTKVRKK